MSSLSEANEKVVERSSWLGSTQRSEMRRIQLDMSICTTPNCSDDSNTLSVQLKLQLCCVMERDKYPLPKRIEGTVQNQLGCL